MTYFFDKKSLLGGCGQLGVLLMAAGLIAFFIEMQNDLGSIALAFFGFTLYLLGAVKQ